MQSLPELFKALELKIPDHALKSQAVSAEGVGWHIQHSALVAERIIHALEQSDPGMYKRKFNWKRSYVFLFNKIPRGRIQAPNSVRPRENISIESLSTTMNNVFAKLRELELLEANKYFQHPFLGELNVKHTVKFLQLHTKHHLKIINEITG